MIEDSSTDNHLIPMAENLLLARIDATIDEWSEHPVFFQVDNDTE